MSRPVRENGDKESIISVRLIIALVLTLAVALALALVLLVTDTALSVWQRLGDLPLWLQIGYAALLALVSLAAVALAWRLLRPRRKPQARKQIAIADADSLQEDMQSSLESGVDIEAALAELHEQRRRKQGEEIHIAVYGEVSSGKSSLVGALVPSARPASDPRAGTTAAIQRFRWRSDGGDRVIITDLPGFALGEDAQVLEEARRAHLVIFLCDSDLTRSQFNELGRLQSLDKPMLVAINKTDRYTEEELSAFMERIRDHSGLPSSDIVRITTGGREEVIQTLADGSERPVERERPAEIEALRRRIQHHLDQNGELMASLQDTAVLLLTSEKLDRAKRQHRDEQAQDLVRRYSRRAVAGALAAVAPGSDLVIQGVLATRLIQELCGLYDVSVKDVQIESFLKLAGGKVRNMSALTLAIAGNGLKAFPGLGTLSGGLLHAVAYGLIFDSLGRAAAETLATRGDFRPLPAARAFEELLNENLESGAERFARLALAARKPDRSA